RDPSVLSVSYEWCRSAHDAPGLPPLRRGSLVGAPPAFAGSSPLRPSRSLRKLPAATPTASGNVSMSNSEDTGLFKESYERDSCGFGLIASLDYQPSRWLVETALTSLNRLTHRGAVATDGKTGD